MSAVFWGVVIAVGVLVLSFWNSRFRGRRKFVRNYTFPAGLPAAIADERPELREEQIEEVISGLRRFFQLRLLAARVPVVLPSRAVEVAWRSFAALDEEGYRDFCKGAFGKVIRPMEAVPMNRKPQGGLKRLWWLDCLQEGRDDGRPSKLPPLFALDRKLGLSDGFRYSMDCPPPEGEFCARDLMPRKSSGAALDAETGE